MLNATDIQHTALITGGTSGLGLEAAVGLARHGMRVLLAGRNEAAGAAAIERIRQETGADRATFVGVDLSVQAQIHDLAQRVRDLTNRLDVLIHGAGVVRARRHETAEGVEETLAVNFLAPRILTEELLPLLKSGTPARIISVTTVLEPLGSLRLHDLQRTEGYHALTAYAGTKRALALWTRDLARQLEGSGVTVNLFDPYVMRTPFATAPDAPLLFKLAGPFLLSPHHAGKGLVRVVTDPRLLNTTGTRFLLGLRFPHLPGTADEHLAQQLRQISDRLIIQPSLA